MKKYKENVIIFGFTKYSSKKCIKNVYTNFKLTKWMITVGEKT